MGAGPIGMPSANPGDEARAVAALRDVIEQLQKILPDVQIGGDLHSAVTQAIRSLSKYSTPAAADPNNQQVRLRQMMAAAGKDSLTQQVMRNLGAGAPGGGQPGANPAGGAPGMGAGGTPPTPPMGGMGGLG